MHEVGDNWMTCVNCGAAGDINAQFCAACGTRLVDDSTATQGTAAPAPPVYPSQPLGDYYQQPAQTYPGYEQHGYPQQGYQQGSWQEAYSEPGYAQPGYLQPAYPPPGYQSAPASTGSGLSTAAFICGGLAFLILPIVLGPIGIVCGAIALRRDQPRAGAALAVAIAGTIGGFIIGAIVGLKLSGG